MRAIFLSSVARTIAPAIGCSEPDSTDAARESISSSRYFQEIGIISVTSGFPSVSVPVLSNTTVSTEARSSSASAFFMSIPF